MLITAYALAARYIGVKELTGRNDHPLISWWGSLSGGGIHFSDFWCSAFVNGMAWELDLPRSKSLAARSWLTVGDAIALSDARQGFDVVVLQRGDGAQPGPHVLDAAGHVGFFSALVGGSVTVLGGNQANAVCLESFPISRVLGVRRIAAL